MTKLWEKMGWMDVEAYLKQDDRVIVPVGSCEQHGRHLSLAVDYLLPVEIGRRVSERTGVPVTPPLCFGVSVLHMDFPGTITLSTDTFIAAIRDILGSLYRHGFRRMMILNAHGGNIHPLNVALVPLLDQHRDLRVKMGHWWEDPRVQQVMREMWGTHDQHATGAETSAIMAIRPDIPQMDRVAYSKWIEGSEVLGPRLWSERYPHGAGGMVDPKLASPEAGERLLAVATNHYVSELEEWSA